MAKRKVTIMYIYILNNTNRIQESHTQNCLSVVWVSAVGGDWLWQKIILLFSEFVLLKLQSNRKFIIIHVLFVRKCWVFGKIFHNWWGMNPGIVEETKIEYCQCHQKQHPAFGVSFIIFKLLLSLRGGNYPGYYAAHVVLLSSEWMELQDYLYTKIW